MTDGKNTTVCGKLAMSTLVNVNYTSILGEVSGLTTKMIVNEKLK